MVDRRKRCTLMGERCVYFRVFLPTCGAPRTLGRACRRSNQMREPPGVIQERFEFISRHGFGEVIALCLITAVRLQELHLLGGFNALGDDLQFHAVGHLDDGHHDGCVLRAGGHVADEATVDLD